MTAATSQRRMSALRQIGRRGVDRELSGSGNPAFPERMRESWERPILRAFCRSWEVTSSGRSNALMSLNVTDVADVYIEDVWPYCPSHVAYAHREAVTPLPNPTPPRTALDADRLTVIRADTRSSRNRYVDPARLEPVRRTVAQLPTAWSSYVLGRAVAGTHALQWGEMVALTDSAILDRIHLDYLADLARDEGVRRLDRERAEVHYRAIERRDWWEHLRRQLPVEVFVGFNWAYGYKNGSNRGRSHIVVQQDLRSGRLHRRAETALCETASRSRPGPRGLDPFRALERTPRDAVGPGDCDRIPDCRACLKFAHRIAVRQS